MLTWAAATLFNDGAEVITLYDGDIGTPLAVMREYFTRCIAPRAGHPILFDTSLGVNVTWTSDLPFTVCAEWAEHCLCPAGRNHAWV